MNVIYLGKSGLFKYEIAREAARGVLSVSNPDTCPEYLEIRPQEGVIPVAQVHRLVEFLAFSSERRRAVVIEKCHLATREFQQSILKLLEDGRADFFLTSEEPLLDTIHSRCTVVPVREWGRNRMEGYLMENGLAKDETALLLSGGRPGLYREFVSDEGRPFLEAVRKLADDLTRAPEKALIRLGALEEGFFESTGKEKCLLLAGFMEEFFCRRLQEESCGKSYAECLCLCFEEQENMRRRGYGKTENFRFFRKLHSVLAN